MTCRWRTLGVAAALLLGTAALGGESPNAPTSNATEAPEATEPSAGAESSDESAPERNAEPESEETLAAPEVFTPSEHISEDIAVPFPVDI